MLFTRFASQTVGGIQVRGTSEFIARTRDSLALLRALPQFAIVQENIAVIRQGSRSGMKAWAPKPTFTVGRPTWRHSVLWYAGAIAHDAYHAKLFLEAKNHRHGAQPEAEDWTGVEAEKKCLAFQHQVLIALNADANIVSYVANCALDPTYQGRHRGWKSWLDYLKRWW